MTTTAPSDSTRSTGGDEEALVSDREGHHLVVGVPGSAEDPNMGGVMPGRGQPVSHCILQGFIDQQPHAV